jgi:hypothetical protein
MRRRKRRRLSATVLAVPVTVNAKIRRRVVTGGASAAPATVRARTSIGVALADASIMPGSATYVYGKVTV